MTDAQFRDALAALGISQARLSRVFQINISTVHRYGVGDLVVPGWLELNIEMLRQRLHTIDEAEILRRELAQRAQALPAE